MKSAEYLICAGHADGNIRRKRDDSFDLLNSRVGLLGRKIFRHSASIPANLAFHSVNLGPIAAGLERRRRRQLDRYSAAPLEDAAEAAVVGGLERDGIFVTDLDALGLADGGRESVLDRGVWAAERLSRKVAAMDNRRRKGTHVAEPGELLAHPVLYQWGLNAALLRIARAYLGLPVAYDGPLISHSPADGQELGVRKWHLDREDWRVIKVALYLNDVDEDCGPFQLLRRPDHGAAPIGQYTPLSAAALQQRLGRAPSSDDIATCTGKAGTLVFADTARFLHRGKPAMARARSAVFFSYFSRMPRHPFYAARCRLSRAQIRSLVSDLDPDQQAAALWRDSLPPIARLIPPSRQ